MRQERPTSPARVAQYRERAASLRSFARETYLAESRARLLALAESFDELADRAEAPENAERPQVAVAAD